MTESERKSLVRALTAAFGKAVDVTPGDGQPAHILLPSLDLPEPWTPSPTRALTVWQDWPTSRPQFLIDQKVVGEGGQPPRSNNNVYLLGESWRGFSYHFAWSGSDPVRAAQLWLTRFTVERA